MIDYDHAREILQKALDKWGTELQVDVAIEEMTELIQRLVQYKRGRVNKQKVLEELVDSWIMLEQLKLVFDGSFYNNNEPDFIEWYERKLLRLENRIHTDNIGDKT